jgi:DNA-binding MarR family transcriptional regulator
VRALTALGPLPIRDLARLTSVTHSAASQTVAQMVRLDLVALGPGRDGEERIADLTDRARVADHLTGTAAR